MDFRTGLSPLAEATYRAMVRDPDWRIDQLQDELGWTVEMIQSALDELAEFALVQRIGPDQDRLTALTPQAALASTIASAEADLERRERRLTEIGRLLSQISAAATVQPTEQVIRHEGVDAVRRRLADCMPLVREEILSLNPGSAQPPDAKAASKPLNQQLLERGASLRGVYQDSFRNDLSLLAYAGWVTALGGRLRTVPVLPTLLIIIDQEVAFIPIDANDSRRGALEVRTPGLVRGSYLLFEQFWNAGRDFGSAAPATRALPAVEQALIQLLADGYTDDAAARRLGLSRRTVSRIMATLSEKTGATSRFQMGVEAAARGWLRTSSADTGDIERVAS